MSRPPPLPPRAASIQVHSPPDENPPDYQEFYHQPLEHSWSAQDPRSRSTQSLVPAKNKDDGSKRTLLLIYIHGFMGNETSFQSFPAHIHNVVTVALADTHVIHTKIYPKYKSRRAIEHARDDFSEWLRPNESPTTDVILIGHSMGGLLASEVALIPADSPDSKFRHHILGIVNFDTPFLGMHPGVIISGIGSLFKPAAAAPASGNVAEISPSVSSSLPTGQSQTTLDGFSPTSQAPSLYTRNSQSALNPENSEEPGPITKSPTGSQPSTAPSYLGSPSASINDPNYNPPFPNDVRLPTRTGWNNALHFVTKHSDGLTQATKAYVTSHLEFGGAVGDYKGLHKRYQKLRALEDARPPDHRIRFVNYYTASTGRPSQPKKAPSLPLNGTESASQEGPMPSEETTKAPEEPDVQGTPEPSQQDLHDTEELQPKLDSESSEHETSELTTHDPAPLTDSETDSPSFQSADEAIAGPPPDPSTPPANPTVPPAHPLPPAPALPPSPTPENPPFDPTPYPSKDVLKLASKEHARLVKCYQSAVRDRDRAVQARRKLLDKRAKEAEKELRRECKARRKEEAKAEAKKAKAAATAAAAAEDDGDEDEDEAARRGSKGGRKAKTPRDRKFCMLPSRVDGRVDGCWVRVFMEGVDEVGAHCGLFLVGAHYEGLVGDVGRRVEGWVRDQGRGEG
ncbi:MAG: hypothetical protein FRX48_08390 [Lasallia pustulata]|uniref:DUF676 domain-containing protein n=1 Tax=Lasallia pustulata TaxID=136370 RepID=A0A5M8PFE1_9LECA|nr:MAG: hypothetical protein FRX48_08390 [Lasallia pustulata]